WMASKRIVDRLLLVTGDTDFVPAMKFARREGVQVVVITVDNRLRQELREHADEVRLVRFPPAGTGTPAASTGPMP
ncbi:MAG: NYN domain-containing protein, partial [Myxococcales bacterium]|nr:NYN domain-containing protein [Myxococcales bacterium]